MGYTQPIVALTANALIGQAEAFIKEGFDSYISKPIQTKHLNSILIKHIRDKQPSEVIEEALTHTKNRRNINDFQSSADVLEKLRMDFARNQKKSFSDISHAINSGDIETAHLLTHTLKGLAGLMGEKALEQCTSDMEQLLEDGKMPSSYQLNILKDEITQLLERIGKPENTVLPNNKDFEKTAAIALLAKLEPLLESHAPDSLDYLNELSMIPETAVLCKQIEGFDFASALKTMNILKSIYEEL